MNVDSSSDVYYTRVEEESTGVQVGYNFDIQTRILLQNVSEGAAQELTEFRREHFANLRKSSERHVQDTKKHSQRVLIGVGLCLA